MIAVHPHTAKHLVLSRLAAAPAPLSVLLRRVHARQEAAGVTVKMSAQLLRRHLRTLVQHDYADEGDEDTYALTPLGELTLIGLGQWQPRYRPLEGHRKMTEQNLLPALPSTSTSVPVTA